MGQIAVPPLNVRGNRLHVLQYMPSLCTALGVCHLCLMSTADDLLLGDLGLEPMSTAFTQSLWATMAPTIVALSTALMPPNKLKIQTKSKAGDTCAVSLPFFPYCMAWMISQEPLHVIEINSLNTVPCQQCPPKIQRRTLL